MSLPLWLAKALLSLMPRTVVERAIIRAELIAERKNRGPLRADQKRKLVLLTRWNNDRS